jgi:anti-repressor protein
VSDHEIFTFEGHHVRCFIIDGAPWWVGKDVCTALGITSYRASLSHLDDDERGVSIGDSPSGQQQYVTVNEAGLYSLILRSRRPEAKRFKRWITHIVLPAIRRTGSYTAVDAVQHKLPGSYAEALRELAATVEQLDAAHHEIAELTPSAQAWEQIVNAKGNYTVVTAAQMLDNLDGVNLGQQRLFDYLRAIGWVKKKEVAGAPRPMQVALDRDWLRLRPRDPHQRHGQWHVSTPQVLVTGKGVRELARRLLNPLGNVAAIESGDPLTPIELLDRLPPQEEE